MTTTRYDRMRAAIPYIEICGRAEDYELAAALRADAEEFERIESLLRSWHTNSDMSLQRDIADRIRGEK